MCRSMLQSARVTHRSSITARCTFQDIIDFNVLSITGIEWKICYFCSVKNDIKYIWTIYKYFLDRSNVDIMGSKLNTRTCTRIYYCLLCWRMSCTGSSVLEKYCVKCLEQCFPKCVPPIARDSLADPRGFVDAFL